VEFAAERSNPARGRSGDTQCGRSRPRFDELRQPQAMSRPNLRAIVDRIRPVIEHCFGHGARDPDALVEERRARTSVRRWIIYDMVRVARARIERDGLVIVGAEYASRRGR